MATFLKNENAKTHVLMCSFLPRCIPLQSWCYRKSGEASKKEQGIISTVRSLSQPAAITILRSLQSAGHFHYQGSNGSLTSSPHLGLKQAFSDLRIPASFKSVIALIAECMEHGDFMTKNYISQ